MFKMFSYRKFINIAVLYENILSNGTEHDKRILNNKTCIIIFMALDTDVSHFESDNEYV